jgi:hypothetical protein
MQLTDIDIKKPMTPNVGHNNFSIMAKMMKRRGVERLMKSRADVNQTQVIQKLIPMTPFDKMQAEIESDVYSKETQVRMPLEPLDFSAMQNENLFSEMNLSIQSPPLSDLREKKKNVFMFRENP